MNGKCVRCLIEHLKNIQAKAQISRVADEENPQMTQVQDRFRTSGNTLRNVPEAQQVQAVAHPLGQMPLGAPFASNPMIAAGGIAHQATPTHTMP